MRLGSGRSSNVVVARGGGGGGRAGLGIGGLVVLLVGAYFGVDTSGLVGQGGGGGGQQTVEQADRSDPMNAFLIDVISDTEQVWGGIYQRAGGDYPEPTLVRFSGGVNTACGAADSRTGPFYCPADQKLYIDPSFFNELSRMGAPGDFAAAYVIAHEIGHHVQNVQGLLGGRRSNEQSVRTELQADCYAGIWAHHAETERDVLEDGEVEEGLAAAAAVGDDRLQEAAGQRVQPETFSHGSSADRAAWFRRGFQSGDVGQCDTSA